MEQTQQGIARTLLVLLAMALIPFVLLVLYAHLSPTWGIGMWPVILAGFAGLLPLAFARWSLATRLTVAAVYAIFAWIILPFWGLLAECSTGNCL